MRNFIRSWWPFLAAVLIEFTAVAVILFSVLDLNQGNLVYTYDDTYIHMAISKNLSLHGVWGITQYGFTSCSSSLFWTALLAFIYLLTGPNEITPFLICIVSSVLLLFTFHHFFRREGIKPLITFISLLLLIYLTYIPFHIFSGLEHILHALVTVLFVYYAAGVISGVNVNKPDIYLLVLFTFMLPLLRYEGLVSVMILCIMLLFTKKYFLSLILLFAGFLPVTVFGLISVSKGWSFFPNSMLMKLNFPDIKTIDDFIRLMQLLIGKFSGPVYIVLIAVFFFLLSAGFIYFKKSNVSISKVTLRNIILILFFLANAFIYYVLSRSVLASRYHMFLVTLAIFLIPVVLFATDKISGVNNYINLNLPVKIGGVIIIVSLYYFAEFNAFNTVTDIPVYSNNIYEQQYQIGKFFSRYYNGEVIALNDIGTSGYLADIKVVDLWGLADYEVSMLRRPGLSKEDLRYLARTRGIKVAIIYDHWFKQSALKELPGGEVNESIIPEEWFKAGEWEILNNIVCGGNKISIYAVDPAEVNNLVGNAVLNSPYLPPTVRQSGIYTKVVY